MEISTQDFKDVQLIAVTGRVDSVEAARLADALQSASRHGKYKIVVDMSHVEYMSSAGFRALGDAQRNSRNHQDGEVVLANVPSQIYEALEMVGFTDYFHIENTVSGALAFAENRPEGDSASTA
jgi:anti-sigma B factor antagonist